MENSAFRTFIAIEEKSILRLKAAKNRLTVLLGGNVSVETDVSLPFANTLCMKGLNKLHMPVYWKLIETAYIVQELSLA